MTRSRTRLLVVLCALAVIAVGAVIWATSGSDEQDSPPVADQSSTSPSPSAASPSSSSNPSSAQLPGSEALSPPPPDPELASYAKTLSSLPAGAASGKLTLTITGLVGFDEGVTGSCAHSADSTTLDLDYADGSKALIEFSATGPAVLTLTAPSAPTVVANLSDVSASAEAGALTMSSTLLRQGTSETTGSFTLDLLCEES